MPTYKGHKPRVRVGRGQTRAAWYNGQGQADKQAMLERAFRKRIAASMDLLAKGLREPERDDFEQLAYRFPELLEPIDGEAERAQD